MVDFMADVAASQAGPPLAVRRHLMRNAGRLAAIAGVAAMAACGGSDESPLPPQPTPTPTGTGSPTPTPTPSLVPVTDADLFTLMIQLHYLQAEFYSRAVFGAPLAAALVTGTGVQGDVTGPRQVTFADAVLGDLMREIAAEKIDQVVRLRGVLGTGTPARPALNLGVDEAGTFTRYGRDSNAVPPASGGAARATFDVYASEQSFLFGAFLVEDSVMTAWRGVSPLMTSGADITVAAGLLATSAHHVGVVRSRLFVRGDATGSTVYDTINRLSDLRDTYSPGDDDQGVGGGSGQNVGANISPTDGEGEIFGRLPQETINVFYMTREPATSGGFFPAGLNGTLRQSVRT